ncbi:recombinase family protein [Streptomyces albipurpureus]|uniref:Recombinase family protein n=1 Tax=Streptomyces albipurpureus TaxID=2897419 RepID=A0ABT0UTH5_9ACTN|nr:recombinase family protein [Streptomyces sp. CWNU-1]MCM2391696.1 recombinase family protein [Streptomyces sp. CWNU-1]
MVETETSNPRRRNVKHSRRPALTAGSAGDRWIVSVRLSRDTDESTSVERQTEEGCRWVEDVMGGVVVEVVVDTDVSGEVSPWKRKHLAEWLTSTPPKPYDGMVALRVDRWARRVVWFSALMDWCRDNGKRINTVRMNIDPSTREGRMFAGIAAMFAENELEVMKERAQETRDTLRQTGRWPGGRVPYGRIKVHLGKDPDTGKSLGWKLDDHRHRCGIIRRAADNIFGVSGIPSSPHAEVQRLNAEGEPTESDCRLIDAGKEPTGTKWLRETLVRILLNPTTAGVITDHDGRIVRGDDGLPVMIARPILSLDEQDQLRSLIESKPHSTTQREKLETPRRKNTGPLSYVQACHECGGLMYRDGSTSVGSDGYRRSLRYRCPSKSKGLDCPGVNIVADPVETWVGEEFLRRHGSMKYVIEEHIPGVSYAGDIAAAETALDELEADRRSGLYKGSAVERFRTQHRSLTERLERLRSLPTREASTVSRDTGRTVADEWNRHGKLILRSMAVDESGALVVEDAEERKDLRERGERGHNELYRMFHARIEVKRAPEKGARSFRSDRLIFTYQSEGDPEGAALEAIVAEENTD